MKNYLMNTSDIGKIKVYTGFFICLLLIVVAGFIALYQRYVKPASVPVNDTIILPGRIDTFFTPREIQKKTTPVFMSKYIPVVVKNGEGDSVSKEKYDSLLAQFTGVYVYEDKWSEDSVSLVVRDSISENKITSRDYKLNAPIRSIVKETIKIVPASPKNQLYLGGGFGYNQNIGPSVNTGILFKTKKDFILNLSIGTSLIHPGINYNFNFYTPIK